MKTGNRSKSSLFLMEMIVVILFFAITSAICIGLFTKAHQTAQDSVELTHAVLLSETAAETFKAAAGQLPPTAAALGGKIESDNVCIIGYDRDWQVTDQQPSYTMTITVSAAEGIATAEILTQKKGAEIYQLTTKVWQSEVNDHE